MLERVGPRRTGVEDGKPPADSDLGHRSRKDGAYNMVLGFWKEPWNQHPLRIPQELVAHSVIHRKERWNILFVIPGRHTQHANRYSACGSDGDALISTHVPLILVSGLVRHAKGRS